MKWLLKNNDNKVFCCFSPYRAEEKGNQGAGQNHTRMTAYRVVQTLYSTAVPLWACWECAEGTLQIPLGETCHCCSCKGPSVYLTATPTCSKCNFFCNHGALHTGPWIWIRCGSGIRIYRPLYLHTTSIRIRAACASDSTVAFGAHARPHWIWTGDPDPVNPVSVPVWRLSPSALRWYVLLYIQKYPCKANLDM